MLGSAAAALAMLAVVADRRRARRRSLDAVGFMPWTTVFLASFLTSCVALGLAVRSWLAG